MKLNHALSVFGQTCTSWGGLPPPRLFAKIASVQRGGFAPTPIEGINPFLDKPVEGGIRPIRHPRHMSVFDGIPMDVIDVPIKILLIADLMLPKPPLPNGTLAMFGSGGVDPGFPAE